MIPALYHWSPTERRDRITRRGLVPGSEPVTGACMPYVCLAENPQAAWRLSGEIVGHAGQSWDLWQAWLGEGHKIVRRRNEEPRDDRHWKEWRVYDTIYRRGLWLVATRVVEVVGRGDLPER